MRAIVTSTVGVATLLTLIRIRGVEGFLGNGFMSRTGVGGNICTLSSVSAHSPHLIQRGGLVMSAKGAVHQITMPALSSTMSEGKIVQWVKAEGDKVEGGDVVMVVESDKADMDVEAYSSGYLAKILTPEGESAGVGETVAVIAERQEDIATAADSSVSSSTDIAESKGGDEGVGEANAVTVVSDDSVDSSFITMPALSSTMTEGKVVQWLVKEGEKISEGQSVMIVESDKADMDVESYEDGYVSKLLVQEGGSVNVGDPCMVIVQNEADVGKGGSSSSAKGSVAPSSTEGTASVIPTSSVDNAASHGSPAQADGHVPATGLARKIAKDLGVPLSTVGGNGPNSAVRASDVTSTSQGGTKTSKSSAWTPAPGVVAATPSARELAKSKGIDVKTITGTGSFNRVTLSDVRSALGIAPESPSPSSSKVSSGAIGTSSSQSSVFNIPELLDGPKAMDGMQKAVAKNMEATIDVPVFRVSRKIRTDNFDNLYSQLKPYGVTVSALLAKAVAVVLEEFPIINAAYKPGQIIYKKDINVAMAVSVDGGLITPTLQNANTMNILGLSERWKQLVVKATEFPVKAKSGKLAPNEYQSGTFTISNMGMFGVSEFGAILPPGMGAILAIGSSIPTVVPNADGSTKVVKEMTVTITCDHRHIYGADAALFLKSLGELLESNYSRLLL